MSDRAEFFTRYSWVGILVMVVAPTRETFPRLFYGIPKNPRFRIGNPILGFYITFWRKTKVIFGISSSSCIELYIYNSFERKFWPIFKAYPGPKSYHFGLCKRYKGIMCDRAEIFTRYSWIYTLVMVVAPTRETFPRLFYRILKNPRFLIENPVLGFHITFCRKTKVIFGINSSSCIGPCIKRVIFVKVNFWRKPIDTGFWPKNPVLCIHITFWRKTKVIFGISASNHIEWYVAQYISQKKFFFEKKAEVLPSLFSKKKFSWKTFYFS
jgi:hypothetical protein